MKPEPPTFEVVCVLDLGVVFAFDWAVCIYGAACLCTPPGPRYLARAPRHASAAWVEGANHLDSENLSAYMSPGLSPSLRFLASSDFSGHAAQRPGHISRPLVLLSKGRWGLSRWGITSDPCRPDLIWSGRRRAVEAECSRPGVVRLF